jgi:hypothetical protein
MSYGMRLAVVFQNRDKNVLRVFESAGGHDEEERTEDVWRSYARHDLSTVPLEAWYVTYHELSYHLGTWTFSRDDVGAPTSYVSDWGDEAALATRAYNEAQSQGA